MLYESLEPLINSDSVDQQLIVINKPPLIHSVSIEKSTAPSVAQLLMKHSSDQLNVSPNKGDGGLINRLDYETSGLLFAATTKDSWLEFRKIFSSSLKKYYLAIVVGLMQNEIKLEGYFFSRHKKSKKISFSEKNRSHLNDNCFGETKLIPVSYSSEYNLTFCHIEIIGGRRHQIRASASYLGFPLYGDKLYSKVEENEDPDNQQFYLHADQLKFNSPFNDKVLHFESPLPAEWKIKFPLLF